MSNLREQKKQQTRAKLSTAARQLAVKHGVRAVSCEAIAAAAGVSARTFFNYFATKEEAILADIGDLGALLCQHLRDRPAAEPVQEAFPAAMREVLDGFGQRAVRQLHQMRALIEKSPELDPHRLALYEGILAEFTEIVAERTHTDPTQLYPRLVSGCLLMSWRLASDTWGEKETLDDIHRMLDAAIAQLVHGIATPLPAPPN